MLEMWKYLCSTKINTIVVTKIAPPRGVAAYRIVLISLTICTNTISGDLTTRGPGLFSPGVLQVGLMGLDS